MTDIPFLEEFILSIQTGRKICTTRTTRYADPGDPVDLITKDRLIKKATLIAVVSMPYWVIRDYLYKPEGFTTPDKFHAAWCRLHPPFKDLTPEKENEPLWVHFWGKP